jgi:hypothetical protein
MNPKIYKPPPPCLITELDLRNWDGQPGDLIHISTRGDTSKMKVVISIRDIVGTALEIGAAKFDPSIDGWWYVTASQPNLDEVLILDAKAESPRGRSGIHAAWIPAGMRLAKDFDPAVWGPSACLGPWRNN